MAVKITINGYFREKKVRVFPVHAKKAYIRNRGKAPLNFNLGPR